MMRIYDYLYELSDEQINQLYGATDQNYSQSQWVCRAIFQSLNEVSRLIIMRLIFLLPSPVSSSLSSPSPLPSSSIKLEELALWFHQHLTTKPINMIHELIQSRILSISSNNEITMNPGFQESLKYNLTGIYEPWAIPDTATAAATAAVDRSDDKLKLKLHNIKSVPTEHELHHECIQKWNNILQFMITCDYSLGISGTVINYLLEAQLMQKVTSQSSLSQNHPNELLIKLNVPTQPADPKKLCITSKGYEYLLLDIQTQVWNFAYECLKKSGSHQIEVLSFLFMLSFCRVGNSYPVSQLTPIQLQLMMEFSHLGIIYRASPQSPRFYPTQIAVNIIIGSGTATHKLKSLNSLTPEYSDDSSSPLISSSSAVPPANPTEAPTSAPSANLSGLELIVETNFQVVAYFTSDLHLAMLSLFVDNRGLVRLPNMALGQVTRDSIKAALKMGIKASQIINFMKIHTHSRVAHRQPLIPENVTDQIKLWESERYRLKLQPSMLLNLHEITSGKHLDELYLLLKKYSQEISVLLWCDDQKKCLVVTSEGYYQLDAYARTLE